MAQNKTQATKLKVSEFLASIEDVRKRSDCRELMKLMREETGPDPVYNFRVYSTSGIDAKTG